MEEKQSRGTLRNLFGSVVQTNFKKKTFWVCLLALLMTLERHGAFSNNFSHNFFGHFPNAILPSWESIGRDKYGILQISSSCLPNLPTLVPFCPPVVNLERQKWHPPFGRSSCQFASWSSRRWCFWNSPVLGCRGILRPDC